MFKTTHPKSAPKGSVLVAVLLVIVMLAGLSAALLTTAITQDHAAAGSDDHMRAVYIADAGITNAIYDLNNSGTGNIGAANAQIVFGDGSYWVATTDNGNGTSTVKSTAAYGGYTRSISVTLMKPTATSTSIGIFSDQNYVISSNCVVDSYDSSKGTYASQITGKITGQNYANKNGNIGSNGSITLDSNNKIMGNANPGPGFTVSIGSAVTVTGVTTAAAAKKVFTPITLPAIASAAATTAGTSATIGPGNFHIRAILTTERSTVTLKGPAVIVADSLHTVSNSNIKIDSTGGPVTLYCTGSFMMDSNTGVTATSGIPSDFQVNITGASAAKLSSNTTLYGVVYAPNATLSLDANIDFYGSVVAKKIIQDSNCRVHFDESLNKTSAPSVYRLAAWREVLP
jgi:hypothetical protein